MPSFFHYISKKRQEDPVPEKSFPEPVRPAMSLHPKWRMSEEDQYVYRYLNQSLPPLDQNQVRMDGIAFRKENDCLLIDAMLRHTIQQGIRLNNTRVQLVDRNGAILAEKVMDLKKLDLLPPLSSRPFRLVFAANDFLQNRITTPDKGWRLTFKSVEKEECSLELNEHWKQILTVNEVKTMEDFISSLPASTENKLIVHSYHAVLTEQGDLHVVAIIRNADQRRYDLKQLPLAVKDASGEIAAAELFSDMNVSIKPNGCKPILFIFTKHSVKKSDIDLTKWEVFPFQR